MKCRLCKQPIKTAPACPGCGEPWEWPANPEAFLLQSGWRKETVTDETLWFKPADRLRPAQRIHVATREDKFRGTKEELFQDIPGDEALSFTEREAVLDEIAHRTEHIRVDYAQPVFSADDIAAARARIGFSPEGLVQVKEMAERQHVMEIENCAACGKWPQGWSQAKALKMAKEHPAPALCIAGPVLPKEKVEVRA